jgi:choline dehydrogenase-like flavoprotein
MERPVIVVRGEVSERTYPERIGFETAESQYFYEASREQGGTAFVIAPANSRVQSPLDIVNEELSKRLFWGEELKAVVQQRFGFGAVIAALVEQLPHQANCISLDPWVRDDLGFAVPKLTHFLDQERELQTIERTSRLLQRLFETLGATNVTIQRGLAPGHQMGGCRMGNDPHSSVVDRDLKVHHTQNLYIVGSSVFPTSGAITPTLTIAALALRLGDYLSESLRNVH